MEREALSHFGLQYITNGADTESVVCEVGHVLRGGCRWVQLRMKDATEEEVRETARTVKQMCDEAGATFIVDDHVGVCKEVGASGVHLGKNDMAPAEARKILGDKYIIGGTCNTAADIIAIADAVDYVGVGPYRFTTTKKNLAPTLGLEGYREIAWEVRSRGINTPIVAIGGIRREDVREILQAGANGIAVSGAIGKAEDVAEATAEFISEIERRE